MLEVLNYPQI